MAAMVLLKPFREILFFKQNVFNILLPIQETYLHHIQHLSDSFKFSLFCKVAHQVLQTRTIPKSCRLLVFHLIHIDLLDDCLRTKMVLIK